MERATRLYKVKTLIEFWCFLRKMARQQSTIDHCNKQLSALYDEKYALLQWFYE